MVYARARNVWVTPTNACDGTSYAAPEVASVLDHIWQANPCLDAEYILAAFDQAMSELATDCIVPQDQNGYTDTNFIARAQSLVRNHVITVTPASTHLGTLGGCPGGVLHGKIRICVPDDAAWTATSYSADPNDTDGDGYFWYFQPTNGVGPQDITFTVVSNPQTPDPPYNCNNLFTFEHGDSLTVWLDAPYYKWDYSDISWTFLVVW